MNGLTELFLRGTRNFVYNPIWQNCSVVLHATEGSRGTPMKIALAQVNTKVGDFEKNLDRMGAKLNAARQAGVSLVLFHELAIFGYPPKDLLLRRHMVRANVEAIENLARQCTDITAVVGFAQPVPGDRGTGIFNSAAYLRNGRIEQTYAKKLLPTYDVFDEMRYFTPGDETVIVKLADGENEFRFGLTICEDLWNDEQFEGRRVYAKDPIEEAVAAGANMILCISASPFAAGKPHFRDELFAAQAREHCVPVLSVNQVGGNDDLLFDGASAVFDKRGVLRARAKAFEEDLLVIDTDDLSASRIEPFPKRIDSIHHGLVMGTRDYVHKCGFSEAVLGLSGGIDSAVTAAIAVDALGPDRVHGVAMPSRYSSNHSVEDAKQLAKNLGISFEIIEIQPAHQAMENSLARFFAKREADVTEENIQARIRGNILMSLSNKFGWLLLTTGNKSELAVGYCTLYGDMCGGLAVLSDVPKIAVYELANRINELAGHPRIPQRTIDKPPSAELKPDQTDQDSLPPYEDLDAILERYVEREESLDIIVEAGFDRTVAERIARLVDFSEYKRKQAAVGLKVTSRAFGTGRRMPIAATFQ